MTLKLKSYQDTIAARAFETVSEAERAIGGLKLKFIGRRLSVALHPFDPNKFAIAIVAGVHLGYVI